MLRELSILITVVLIRCVIKVDSFPEVLDFATDALTLDDVCREILTEPISCLIAVKVMLKASSHEEMHADCLVCESLLWS